MNKEKFKDIVEVIVANVIAFATLITSILTFAVLIMCLLKGTAFIRENSMLVLITVFSIPAQYCVYRLLYEIGKNSECI
jgi:hypothetical protein